MGTKNNTAATVVSLYVIVGAMGEDSAHVLRRALGRSVADWRGEKTIKLHKVQDASDGRLPDLFAVTADTDAPAVLVESLTVGETRTMRSEYLAVRSDLLTSEAWNAPRFPIAGVETVGNPCHVPSADFDADKVYDAVMARVAPIAAYMDTLPDESRQPIASILVIQAIEELYTKRRGRGEARYLLSRGIPREGWEAFTSKLYKAHGAALANDFAAQCVKFLADRNGHVIVD